MPGGGQDRSPDLAAHSAVTPEDPSWLPEPQASPPWPRRAGRVTALREATVTAAIAPCTADSVSGLQTHLSFAALPTAPACARGHVRSVAHEWGLPGLAETAELLASELVTNAVQAYNRSNLRGHPAITPVIRLRLVSDGLSIAIYVWDACDEMPVRQCAGPDEIGGRGLLLVESLGKDWGAYREAGGKVVWVLISLPGDS
jgi:anti-sigma regulatory factor (Ser/Thr protein kinase)